MSNSNFFAAQAAQLYSDSPLPAGCLGARNTTYYETYSLGNPGLYENFAFGVNVAGYVNDQHTMYDVISNNTQYCPLKSIAYWEEKDLNKDLNILKDLRTKVLINTYGVSAPHVEIVKDYPGYALGVFIDQVRTINY